ncbi:Ger(x)C family spore germination protein [Metabacillus iocasae]|uniref:Spore germination protein KC n=1 Tax=Priestia iocasae TaxID=2291674 RepID=A0ABS2QRW8_9BACI|nr:Ger(x)C family spore germination protein [Metabacillus iocasae]MBM7702182.1 spore germination protein KC [Metabacillus iocasae]
MKKYLLVIVLCCTTFLSGCWDLIELSELSVVSGLAVDKGENKRYKVSVEAVNATQLNPKTGGNASPSILFSVEGDDIGEVTQKMNIGLSRHLVYSHMRAVVISEEVAKEGVNDIFDFLERNREIRNDFNIVIARGSEAADILSVVYPLQKVSSMKINAQLETLEKEWGGDPGVRLNDMIQALLSKGREPVAAGVSIEGSAEKGESMENMQKVKLDAIVKADSLAVLKKGKFIGYLDLEDTRQYLMITDKLKHTTFTIPCGENDYFAIRVYHNDTVTHVKYKKGTPRATVSLTMEAYIDSVSCKKDLGKVATYEEFEKLAEQYISKKIEQTIEKTQQQYGADIFGFGEKMFVQDYRNFKKVEKRWNEEFVDMEIDVDTVVKIRRSGIDRGIFIDETS